MSDPMQNLNNAAAALNQVAERAGAFWDDADQRISAKEAQASAFLTNAAEAIGAPSMLAFDPTVLHSKTSLFAAGMVADPNAAWQSNWFNMAGQTLPASSYLYRGSSGRAFALTSRNWRVNTTGSTDNPPYSSDYSQTVTDFVLASHYATSGDINQWFLDNPDAVNPEIPSHSGNTAWSGELPIATIPGLHPYHSLWVRFRNEISPLAIDAGRANEQSPLQDIQTFGGNAFCGLHAVTHHPF